MSTIAASFRLTRAQTRILASLSLGVALCYLLSPYVALWRLSTALQTQDCATLRSAIDWNRVRASLQRELAGDDAPAAAPARSVAAVKTVAAADDDLPAFGESFASTAVTNAMATDLTPESVAAMLHDHPVTMVNAGASLLGEVREAVDWAFFSGPRSFDVWLRASEAPGEKPVRLQLAFTRQHGWRVVSVWLPQDLLAAPAAADATHST